MRFTQRQRRAAAHSARAWAVILLCYVLGLIGMAGPSLAILHFYYEPLCRQFAEERGAANWSYSGSTRKTPKRCYAGGTFVKVMDYGGPTAVILTIVYEFFPPIGMFLGIMAGALARRRIWALLDWMISFGRRPPRRQRGRAI